MKRKRVLFPVFVLVLILFSGMAARAQDQPAPDLASIEVLDLETAQRIALADNPDMTAALARVEQARARVMQAAAAWWPEFNLTGDATRVRLAESAFDTPAGLSSFNFFSFDRTQENYRAGIQASWMLFDGFFRVFNQRQAQFARQSAEAARLDTQRLLAAAVAEAFLNTQLSQSNRRIAEADRDFYIRQLEDAVNRFEVGAGAWGDVLNFRVQLNAAKTSVLLSTRQMEADQYGLAALLGLPAGTFPPGVRLRELEDEPDLRLGDLEPDKLIEQALALRPDIRQLELSFNQAEALIGQAEAAFYPSLQLAGSVTGISEDDPGFSGDDFGNTIGLNLAWNLFNGGADRARKFEAEQARREVRYTLAGLRNEVAAQVRQGVALLHAAREQVELQRESVKLVEENRELARNEYEAGEASLVRLNEAQRDLTATYGRLAQSVVALHRARHRLLETTGRNLLQEENSTPAPDQ